ncbi:ribbon-helix-helix domain-containing protein [Actinomycetota bacterium]
MKLSVSLTEQDVAALDDYVEKCGLSSRSAGVQLAIRRLREPELEHAYAEAWDEWAAAGDEEAWAAAGADGVGNGPTEGPVRAAR